eukprot:m.57597 g.57597  ORF g.57597 m.57597 type:complete len:176 (+) comp22412_c0_seq3:1560-2087(+)
MCAHVSTFCFVSFFAPSSSLCSWFIVQTSRVDVDKRSNWVRSTHSNMAVPRSATADKIQGVLVIAFSIVVLLMSVDGQSSEPSTIPPRSTIEPPRNGGNKTDEEMIIIIVISSLAAVVVCCVVPVYVLWQWKSARHSIGMEDIEMKTGPLEPILHDENDEDEEVFSSTNYVPYTD